MIKCVAQFFVFLTTSVSLAQSRKKGHLEPDFSMWQLVDFGALMGEIMATYGHHLLRKLYPMP
jgi:hypothetical protein